MLTGAQMRAARALVRWTVEDLAKAARVGVMTVRRAEAIDGPTTMLTNNLAAIRAALEGAGVIFVEENGEGPGVRLRKAGALDAKAQPGHISKSSGKDRQ